MKTKATRLLACAILEQALCDYKEFDETKEVENFFYGDWCNTIINGLYDTYRVYTKSTSGSTRMRKITGADFLTFAKTIK